MTVYCTCGRPFIDPNAASVHATIQGGEAEGHYWSQPTSDAIAAGK